MKKTFTKLFFRAPIIVLSFLFIATGCHTPEDLREIGPQQEVMQAEWSPEGVNSPNLGDSQSTTLPDHGDVIGGNDDGNGGVNQTLSHTRTPFVMSRRSRKRRCQGC